MIRNLTAGPGIHISNNSFSIPYIDSTRPSSGMVRYMNNNLEVYDGNSWMIMQSIYPQVELSGDVQTVINWARAKMAEEARVQELAANHPSVADALTAVKHAEEQVRIVAALVDTE